MSGSALRAPKHRREVIYSRSPDVQARKVGADTFLSSGPEGTIHTLDPVASAFWSALEQPRSFQDILELFVAAFPDVPPATLERDLAKLAGSLEKRGLVSARDPNGKPGKGT
jgi:hypothetical protein